MCEEAIKLPGADAFGLKKELLHTSPLKVEGAIYPNKEAISKQGLSKARHNLFQIDSIT